MDAEANIGVADGP